MKKEINPVIIVVVLVVVLVVAGGAYFLAGGGASGGPIDVKTLDPKDLRDEEPIRRGQPGYRERITDPPTK